jgi:YHS domain-containing protein
VVWRLVFLAGVIAPHVFAQVGPPAAVPGGPPPAQPADEPVPASSLDGEATVIPAIKGYCPVAYFAKGAAVKGDERHSLMHAGEVYYFSDAESREKFKADPGKYLPQFGGLCTTALGGSYGNRLPADPTVFELREGKLYLFTSERSRRAFAPRPEWFIERAIAIYAKPALDGYDPVAYQERAKAMKGYRVAQHSHAGRVYYFVNDKMRENFAADPERYLPKYDAYCAHGMSRGRPYPADPRLFAVYDQKTYLFFDENAMIEFMTAYPDYIQKADAEWARMQSRKAESEDSASSQE